MQTTGIEYIAYLFADTPGLIKCGSYEGTGGTSVVTIPLPFTPAFVLAKNIDNTDDWVIADNKQTANLVANESASEAQKYLKCVNNGFTVQYDSINKSDDTFIYVAIAEGATAGEFGPTGELLEDANSTTKTINLINTTGTWETGGPVVKKEAIDAALECC